MIGKKNFMEGDAFEDTIIFQTYGVLEKGLKENVA